MYRWAMITAFGFAVWCATSLEAQVCFRGQPRQNCESFIITEIGFAVRLTQEPFDEGLTSGELGYMVNVDERYSLGGTAYGAFEDFTDPEPDSRFGVKGRIRAWLTDWLSLELAPGILKHQGSLGFTGHASLNVRDQIILISQLEQLNYKGRKTAVWYAGMRLGSKPALGAAVAGLLAVAIASMSWSMSSW